VSNVIQVVHWLLLAVIVLYLITGFGITQFRVVEQVTFGLLSKNLAFQVHDNLLIPFIVLLGLHIYQQAGKASKV
jgi:cytochrome b subunit of formate dehydrogenase